LSARILVIDDETNIRLMIRLTLEHVGYKVDVASDGHEGLAKFGDGAGWDLVLLDQRMPGLPGIEVLQEVYRRNHTTRLIMITAFGTIDLALEAIQSGAADFLRKPFTSESLRAAVKSALERETRRMTAVPVDRVCREFTRTTINGFSFDDGEIEYDKESGDLTCHFPVTRAQEAQVAVKVVIPAYVKELVKAYMDTDRLPYGNRLWQALAEESLANYLWQNAELPPGQVHRVEDLSTNLREWLDRVLSVELAENHG